MTIESQLLMLHRAELQIEKWEKSTHPKTAIYEIDSSPKVWERPVITISREPGCNSGSIARMLAQEFGFDLFGRELVDLIARSAHLTRQVVATLDEKTQSALEDMLAESSLCEEHFSSKNYLWNLSKVVFSIAAHGNAVILGRGANFLLQPEDRLAIRFVAPLAVRVKKVMWKQKLSEKQSREYLAAIEEQRRLFVKKHFHLCSDNRADYDIVINTASIEPKTIIEIVRAILDKKMRGERRPSPVGEWSAQGIAR